MPETLTNPRSNPTGDQREQLLGPELGENARLRFADHFEPQRRPVKGPERD